MCNKLEEETKAYGASFLISGPLHDICTEELQTELRLIDIVHVKGMKEPTAIYTCDLDEFKVQHKDVSEVKEESNEIQKRKRLKLKTKIKEYYLAVQQDKKEVAQIMKTDQFLVAMREPYTKKF